MSATVTVGIADLKVVRSPDALVTFALGSCVGICLYDSTAKVAGLSHIMLPCSRDMNNSAAQPFKFADTGVAELIRHMQQLGAQPSRLTAKIAGGAQMFAAMTNSSIANIGDRNVVAVKAALAQHHIPIIKEDTGSDYGRTLYFYGEDGGVLIKSAKYGEKRM